MFVSVMKNNPDERGKGNPCDDSSMGVWLYVCSELNYISIIVLYFPEFDFRYNTYVILFPPFQVRMMSTAV